MSKRNRKAHRGSRNGSSRPRNPVAYAPRPALETTDPHSLAGAILAAVHAASPETSPDGLNSPDEGPADISVEAIGGRPVVESASDSASASSARQEAPDGPPRDSLHDFDAAFFARPTEEELALRARQESFPPVAEDVLDPKKPEPPSPELLARRSRFRKVVGAVVALAVVVMVGGVAKNLVAGGRHLSSSPASAVAAVRVSPAVRDSVVPPNAIAVAAPVVDVSATPPVLPATTPEEATERVVDDAVPEPATASEARDGVDAKAEALRLLNAGEVEDAVPMARAAVAADPSDALPYLYLGSALQELGKHKEAIEVYGDCVRNARKGRVWECRAMGGKK